MSQRYFRRLHRFNEQRLPIRQVRKPHQSVSPEIAARRVFNSTTDTNVCKTNSITQLGSSAIIENLVPLNFKAPGQLVTHLKTSCIRLYTTLQLLCTYRYF
jgi:hypothetical protein